MFPSNTWCFDLEIIKAILSKGEVPVPGIAYCNGWTDYLGMGVAILVARRLDNADNKIAFTGDPLFQQVGILPLSDFQLLVDRADLLIGHNSRGFDAKVLQANGVIIPERKHLDFYHEVKLAQKTNFPKGFKLELLSPRCGGPSKTDSGALAPHRWQRGEKLRVLDYCRNDIEMVRAVALYYALHGGSIPDLQGGHVRLRSVAAIQAES